jgi:hypothetical protein
MNNRIIYRMFPYCMILSQNKCIKTFLLFLTSEMWNRITRKKIRLWIWKKNLRLNRKIFSMMKYLMRLLLDLFCKSGKEIWIFLLI